MYQLFIGSLILSAIHAFIPNHWLPLIAIGKTEKWTPKEAITYTTVVGFAHILSTVLIGIVVGFIGLKLTFYFEFISGFIAPTVLVIIGIIFIAIEMKNNKHKHFEDKEIQSKLKNKSKFAIVLSLSFMMFLSPCAELEAYYFQAGTLGWNGILIVSAVYTIATVSFMIILVYLGLIGLNKFKFHFLEHYEKRVTGFFLIILGIASYFIKF